MTLLPGDSGHLTYGRSQTTLASGNLHLLIKAYCEAPNAQFATALETYLNRLADRDVGLDRDATFRGLYNWPHKLDHMLRWKTGYNLEHVEGQSDVQETPAA